MRQTEPESLAEINFHNSTSARTFPVALIFLDRADGIPDGRFVQNSACEVYNRVNQGSMAVSGKTAIHSVNIFGSVGISSERKRSTSVRRDCGACSGLPLGVEQGKTITGGNMKRVLICLLICAAAMMAAEKTVYEFSLNSIDGQPAPLAAYKGKVVLLVNVASLCGFTPQYSALESTYEKFKDRGFVIVGIPANNFGSQEPGSNQEIKKFCTSKFHVSFPMMAKVSVKGEDIDPLYQFLTDKAASPKTGGEIKWNFTKFLIGPEGHVIARFEPAVTPDSPEVTSAIEKALASLKS
jgi:glutathione peroxidase